MGSRDRSHAHAALHVAAADRTRAVLMRQATRKPLPAHAARACSRLACPRPARTEWRRDLTRTACRVHAEHPFLHRIGQRGTIIAVPVGCNRSPLQHNLRQPKQPPSASQPATPTGDRTEHPVTARSERSHSHADRRADRRISRTGCGPGVGHGAWLDSAPVVQYLAGSGRRASWDGTAVTSRSKLISRY